MTIDGIRGRPRPEGRQSSGRNAALYALGGTIVGALASFGGAYVTSQQDATLDALATKRTAFAAYVAEAEQYYRQLTLVKDALEAEDPDRMKTEYAALSPAGGELYAASALVYLVGDRNASLAATEVRRALLDWSSFDANANKSVEWIATIDGILDTSGPLIADFIEAARRDLDDE